MHRHLDFLLSAAMPGALAPEHLDDLRKSGLTDETIAAQKIRSVPPSLIQALLGFSAPSVVSAYLIPFADPRGGWMDHVRLKVFPSIETERKTTKYLQPPRSGVRIFFPVGTLQRALHSAEPLYLAEGEKKCLAVAQEGYPAIGICGIDGWHERRSRALHPDLDDVGLSGRTVRVIPDADCRTNPNVARAVRQLGEALSARGATALLVRVPAGYKGIDDYLAARP